MHLENRGSLFGIEIIENIEIMLNYRWHQLGLLRFYKIFDGGQTW